MSNPWVPFWTLLRSNKKVEKCWGVAELCSSRTFLRPGMRIVIHFVIQTDILEHFLCHDNKLTCWEMGREIKKYYRPLLPSSSSGSSWRPALSTIVSPAMNIYSSLPHSPTPSSAGNEGPHPTPRPTNHSTSDTLRWKIWYFENVHIEIGIANILVWLLFKSDTRGGGWH